MDSEHYILYQFPCGQIYTSGDKLKEMIATYISGVEHKRYGRRTKTRNQVTIVNSRMEGSKSFKIRFKGLTDTNTALQEISDVSDLDVVAFSNSAGVSGTFETMPEIPFDMLTKALLIGNPRSAPSSRRGSTASASSDTSTWSKISCPSESDIEGHEEVTDDSDDEITDSVSSRDQQERWTVLAREASKMLTRKGAEILSSVMSLEAAKSNPAESTSRLAMSTNPEARKFVVWVECLNHTNFIIGLIGVDESIPTKPKLLTFARMRVDKTAAKALDSRESLQYQLADVLGVKCQVRPSEQSHSSVETWDGHRRLGRPTVAKATDPDNAPAKEPLLLTAHAHVPTPSPTGPRP